tara:strand:- start:5430 stop:5690 length:261 start_codon:yes stop_codon:yes gene_type:complete
MEKLVDVDMEFITESLDTQMKAAKAALAKANRTDNFALQQYAEGAIEALTRATRIIQGAEIIAEKIKSKNAIDESIDERLKQQLEK